MSKTRRTPLTKEEIKEHHEFKKKKKEVEEKYLEQFLEEQYEELRHPGLRDNDQEQGKSVHEEQQTNAGGSTF